MAVAGRPAAPGAAPRRAGRVHRRPRSTGRPTTASPEYLLAVVGAVLGPAAALAWARWGRTGAPRPPAGDRGRHRRAPWRPAVAAAVLLPIGYVDHVRAVNARARPALGRRRGRATRRSASRPGRRASAVAYAACLAIGRRARQPWLAVGVAAWIAVAVFVMLQPVVIDPLFASTRPLRDPCARGAACEASSTRWERVPARSRSRTRPRGRPRRTRSSTASGRPSASCSTTRRCGARRPTRLRALLAHELGHVQRRHTLKGVLWFGVLGLPALWVVLAVAERAARRRGLDGRTTRARRRSSSPACSWPRPCSRPSRT